MGATIPAMVAPSKLGPVAMLETIQSAADTVRMVPSTMRRVPVLRLALGCYPDACSPCSCLCLPARDAGCPQHYGQPRRRLGEPAGS
jgi:hypothetical protein